MVNVFEVSMYVPRQFKDVPIPALQKDVRITWGLKLYSLELHLLSWEQVAKRVRPLVLLVIVKVVNRPNDCLCLSPIADNALITRNAKAAVVIALDQSGLLTGVIGAFTPKSQTLVFSISSTI